MTQSEIFTVLVTGSADTDSADPEEVEAKAASVLAAMSNPALQRQLNEKLHVDRVGVGFGESTEQPILSAGKNVTKKVYVETQYHHNAPRRENRAELRVEYRFATRWSVETFFGDAAAGGVDLFWGRAFDSKRKR
jgi:autotransporter translocation and assembly factor TamB